MTAEGGRGADSHGGVSGSSLVSEVPPSVYRNLSIPSLAVLSFLVGSDQYLKN